MKKITPALIQEYQKALESLKTIGEFKQLGRDIRDKHSLTDKQAIDILSNRNILEILKEHG